MLVEQVLAAGNPNKCFTDEEIIAVSLIMQGRPTISARCGGHVLVVCHHAVRGTRGSQLFGRVKAVENDLREAI